MDLGMHRAGVDGAFGHVGWRRGGLVQILCGISGEFAAADGRAEMIGRARMVKAVL
jgi:hypothetical protein